MTVAFGIVLAIALAIVAALVVARPPRTTWSRCSTPATARLRLVPRHDIFYVQAHGDFARIVTADGRYLLRATLAELERRWEPFGFVRVHRGFIANLKQAIELRPQLGGTAELVLPGEVTVPVARRHVAELRQRLSV